jgi:DNA-directed RNA polymerase subunit RPC12/RpoP
MPENDASYVCGACGEDIVVPVDLAEGEEQEYVEDCPVCCHPNVLHVTVDARGNVTVRAELE